ncbi:MAG TPA: hypothetical protein VH744_07955 [Terriglobales bacterium]|jgi:hypothetical protein
MLHFACDWCSKIKRPEEAWILGVAAETVGVTAARREVTILSGWNYERAVLPLAVHFCSLACKDKYVARVFHSEAPAEEVVVERVLPEEVEVERRLPTRKTIVTKAKSRKVRHKRAA